MKKSDREITIKGFITPSEWDSKDNVTEVSITTDDDEYIVELNRVGEELFDYLYDDVEVTGTIRENGKHEKRVEISHYELLEGDDDE